MNNRVIVSGDRMHEFVSAMLEQNVHVFGLDIECVDLLIEAMNVAIGEWLRMYSQGMLEDDQRIELALELRNVLREVNNSATTG